MTHFKTVLDRGFIRTFTGPVSSAEYLAEVEKNQASEDFSRLRFVINDFRDARIQEDWRENLDFIAAISKVAKSYNPYLKIAYVTEDEEFGQFAAKTYRENKHRSHEFSVFKTLEAATEWAKSD